jgi:hypothetical protein
MFKASFAAWTALIALGSLASNAAAQSAPDNSPNVMDVETRLKGEAGKKPPSTTIVDGWEVGMTEDNECYAGRSYEGGTFLVINQSADDPKIVTLVGNPDWSIVEGKKYPNVKFNFGDRIWTDHHSDGDGKLHAIVSVWKPEFELELWTAEGVEITQDGRFVDRLSLRGLKRALSEVTACLARIEVAEKEAKRKRTIEAFPKDPFAADKPPKR